MTPKGERTRIRSGVNLFFNSAVPPSSFCLDVEKELLSSGRAPLLPSSVPRCNGAIFGVDQSPSLEDESVEEVDRAMHNARPSYDVRGVRYAL